MSELESGVTLVAAVARNAVIGQDGGMPWHLPQDLRHFRLLTTGHPMVMGRKTFDSIGRPLPGRTTIVITRDPSWSHAGVLAAGSLPDAIALGRQQPGGDEVMVVGGGEIYAQAMPLADTLEITRVDQEVQGDTTFPEIDPRVWKLVAVDSDVGYAFHRYFRRTAKEIEFQRMLDNLDPQLRPGRYIFATVAGPVPAGVNPVVTVVEPEGTTLVLPVAEARQAGVDGSVEMAWIQLGLVTSLTAVGLTSVLARALAQAGIAANVVAGYHHDHLFVPAEHVDEALTALAGLADPGGF